MALSYFHHTYTLSRHYRPGHAPISLPAAFPASPAPRCNPTPSCPERPPKTVSPAKLALIRFEKDCARHLAQRILVRQIGNMQERETWCDVAETFGIVTIIKHDPGGCLGRYVDAPDAASGVIYCNTAQSEIEQARVVCHELAHALMCVLPDLLHEVESGEAMMGRLVNGRKARHEIACLVTALCITCES